MHDIKSVHPNDMQSACVTFFDTNIYPETSNEFLARQSVVYSATVLATTNVYLRKKKERPRSVRYAKQERKRSENVYSATVLVHLLELLPKSIRVKRSYNAPIHSHSLHKFI